MAILGILTVEPMSGYDIKQFCEESLSHFWYESYGNLYPRLKRLREAGLIRGRRTTRTRGPDATVYSPTKRGLKRLGEWLLEPTESEHVRSEFMLKVFFGSHVGPEVSEQRIHQYEQEQKQLRGTYQAIEQALRAAQAEHAETAYWLMSLRRGQLLTAARLRWCRECRAMFEEIKKKEPSQ
jgi:DNA-binding PadR family transcriptional regulator